MDSDGSNPTNLSNNTLTSDSSCTWSADGSRIVFTTFKDGNAEIYSMKADGSGQTRITVNSAVEDYPAWQPVWF